MTKKKFKINWWKLLRNVSEIRNLVDNVVTLYEKIKLMSTDPEINKLITEIEYSLDEIFG